MSTDESSYTGSVAAGGPAAVRPLSTLVIRKASVGPMDNNAYLLTCRVSGAQLLIDAAADPDRLMRLVREGSTESRLDTVVTTHSHHDHIGALGALLRTTGARAAAGVDDIPAIEEQVPVAIDTPLRDGDVIRVGVHDLEVIGLRGHTPGSVALLFRGGEDGDHLFTGDSLFPGGVGATKGDADRFAQLIDDVEHRIFDRLPDETWVYPGHGADTTLGAERPHVPAWRERGW
ncbi:MBL fold metallo-hydrolase [Brachybacterium nesterenkovii]|uniref:MBL fold metallo-hydrolase n=1 Tax=Brachybacterium nesterenkovii TaxID=47847 RepID=UPI00321A1565